MYDVPRLRQTQPLFLPALVSVARFERVNQYEFIYLALLWSKDRCVKWCLCYLCLLATLLALSLQPFLPYPIPLYSFFNIIYFAFYFSFSSTFFHFLFLVYIPALHACICFESLQCVTNLRCVLCFYNNALFLDFSHFIAFALCYSLKTWIKIYGHTSFASHQFFISASSAPLVINRTQDVTLVTSSKDEILTTILIQYSVLDTEYT